MSLVEGMSLVTRKKSDVKKIIIKVTIIGIYFTNKKMEIDKKGKKSICNND